MEHYTREHTTIKQTYLNDEALNLEQMSCGPDLCKGIIFIASE